MRKISISSFIFVTCLLVALATLIIITLTSLDAFRRAYHQHIAEDLATYARLFQHEIKAHLETGAYEELGRRCHDWTTQTGARVTVMAPDGTVLADSEHDPATMDNHGERAEVRDALTHKSSSSIRYSDTLNLNMFYHAFSLYRDADLIGVGRVALPLAHVHAVLAWVYLRIFVAAAGVALLTLLISMLVSRSLNRSVETMTVGVRRFAQGDFSDPLPIPRLSEAAMLSESLNEMAAQLNERLRSVIKERNQQEAVLSSMVEGVLAVDNHGRIMTFNQATARLTGINFDQTQNAFLREIAPNTPLSQFVLQILNSAKPKESEFGNLSQGGRILQVHGSVLRDAHGKGIGAVVVLNDVTRLRRLEQVRRDFVANVSHELRTPITSIKGFVETLLDGALESPEDARRFLEIVAKQSDRLNAILGDLLMLSRVEEGEEKASIELGLMGIREPLEAAMQLCVKKASAKDIAISLECAPDIEARINPSLFEQAVTNLIDNAVKYSPSGSEVAIRAGQDGEVVINVEDRGCGIAAEHLPRLFERFYRVDKARSRALGGTGLGLAIVNHVITAHGGRVTVESAPGAGSTFSIYLPAVGQNG